MRGRWLAGVAALVVSVATVSHIVFGVETDLDALPSPTHLLLFSGMALIVTSPLPAAWAAPDDRDARRLTTFLPAVLSLTLLTALVAFFLMYASAFTTCHRAVRPSTRPPAAWWPPRCRRCCRARTT